MGGLLSWRENRAAASVIPWSWTSNPFESTVAEHRRRICEAWKSHLHILQWDQRASHPHRRCFALANASQNDRRGEPDAAKADLPMQDIHGEGIHRHWWAKQQMIWVLEWCNMLLVDESKWCCGRVRLQVAIHGGRKATSWQRPGRSEVTAVFCLEE